MSSVILSRGCISYFINCDPTTTDLGPFYPLIISFFYKFTSLPIKNIVVFQTLIHIICCFIFTCYLKLNYRIRSHQSLLILAFTLLNPLSLGWQRYFLPDTFSLDLALIVLLLIDSYRLKNDYKYLCFSSIFISIGALIRYDFYILIIPLIAIFFINNFRELLGKRSFFKVIILILNLFLISSLSLSFWAVRNIKLGLPPIRNAFFSVHQNIKPEVIDWIKAWTINTYDLPKGIYPYIGSKNDTKSIENRIKPPVWALNKELKSSLEDDPFLLEDKTVKLAIKQAKAIRSNYLINTFNNFKRIIWILFGPFYSGGLHLEKSYGGGLNLERFSNILEIGNIKLAFIKILNFAMRMAIFISCVSIYLKNSIRKLKLLNLALLFLFFDLAFCLYQGLLEQRYLNDSLLFLQFALMIEYFNIFKYRNKVS